MALLRGVGRVMKGFSPGRGTMGTLGVVGVGAGLAVGGSAFGEESFSYATEMLLGDARADNAIMGTDMSWGNWVNPIRNPAVAGAGGGILGGILGGSFGAARGGFKGAVAGALLGGAIGGGAGAYGAIGPYLNPTIMGNAFAEDKAQAAMERMATRNREAGMNLYDIPNSIYPRAPRNPQRLYDTGATGDMVFGMYNMRMA